MQSAVSILKCDGGGGMYLQCHKLCSVCAVWGGVGGGKTRLSCRRFPRWKASWGRLHALVSKAGETWRSDLKNEPAPALREELQPSPCACEIPLFPHEFAGYSAA